jgi:hypothetical protein
VTNANQLLLPSRKLLEKSATTPAGAKSSTTASAAPGPVNSQTYDSAANRSVAAAAAPACTTARLRDYAVPDRPALIATGTVAGAPVVILIYDGTGTPSAYVIRVSDCALVKKLPLG